ncbi:MAG TPA: type IX secretion system membrane protein PorP/SprF [Chitinophagaceae bacterium]|nr:type IX secretion system membrane protein PorP/SprF [Chitinophagaceae bacterium]
MKKLTLIIIVMLVALQLYAQQRPYYTQYVLNDFIINPAVAGIENYWDVKLSHRHQWVGLEGSPVTTYATIQGPLQTTGLARETPFTVHPKGENPLGDAYYQTYEAAQRHFGLGFTIINDATGPLNRFGASASLAYHIPVAEGVSLSSGFSLGIQNMRLDQTKLDFGAQYPADPAVAGSGYLNRIKPDISAGVFLYAAHYFIGLAAQQIIPEKIGFGNTKVSGDTILINGKLVPHLFLQAGYRFLVTPDINFMPSVTVKYITPLPLSVDINAKLQYRDLLWVGGSFRPNDGFAAMLGLNINSLVNIGYSYDITTSQLNTVSRGTHEIVVGFLLGNKYGNWCPRNVW